MLEKTLKDIRTLHEQCINDGVCVCESVCVLRGFENVIKYITLNEHSVNNNRPMPCRA